PPPPARSVPLAQPAAPPFFPGACARSVTGYQLPVSCSPGLAASGTTGNGLLATGYWQLAGQEGIEPPTPGFGDRCSANGATVLYLPRGFAPRTPLHALSRPTSQCASFAWLARCAPSRPRRARRARAPSYPSPSFVSFVGYLVSRWPVCLRQKRQYFENSRRSLVFFLFFVVL